MNPLFRIDFSISDSLKIVRKSVLIYETIIGCPYLSDLPYYKRAVWFEMKRLCLSDYPKKQLEDFSRYVFGVPYAVIQEALQRKDVMKHGRNACAD